MIKNAGLIDDKAIQEKPQPSMNQILEQNKLNLKLFEEAQN